MLLAGSGIGMVEIQQQKFGCCMRYGTGAFYEDRTQNRLIIQGFDTVDSVTGRAFGL